ncbi:MAG: winged helix-turn-helix domain-containing protein [Lysobacterales bacterium]
MKRRTNAGNNARADHSRFAVGDFTLDLDRGSLLRDGEEVALRPKSYQILVYLVQHAGALAAKEELLAAAWPDVVVTDDSLTQCLIDIRKALGDSSRTMIRTVPRRGYVLELPVAAIPADGPEIPGRRKTARLAVAALALAIVLGTIWWGSERTAQAPAGGSAPGSNTVAVLPFEDMSPGGDREYFADGIAEEILNQLAQNTDLVVIARTSSFSFKDEDVDIPTIARKLGVANVLEGSVRLGTDKLRITAQLVDGSTGAHIWSHTYDHATGDQLAMQDDISRDIAQVLHAKIQGRQTSPTPHNSNAYQAYFRGRFFYNRRGPGDLDRASEAFDEALTLDPVLADAWVGLAGLLQLRADEDPGHARELMASAKAALDHALELDPDNVEAHARMAQYYASDNRMEQAFEQLEIAQVHGQNNALVQGMLAGIAYWKDHLDEVIAYQQRAVELDPLALVGHTNLANYYLAAGRYDDSLAECRIAADLAPEDNPMVLSCMSRALVSLKRYDEAVELLEQVKPNPETQDVLAIALWALGRGAESDAIVRHMADAGGVDNAARLAEVEAFKGNLEGAFRWLNEATRLANVSNHSPGDFSWYIELYHSPLLEPLHGDARWARWTRATDAKISGAQS